MSAYVKFVCDYCGNFEVEFWDAESIGGARARLESHGWDTSAGDMCNVCKAWNV